MTLVQADKRYTYQDYLTWSDDERWEIIDGVPYNMTPAPINKHQIITRNLFRMIDPAAQNQGFEAMFAPVDVVFSDYNVVQPDIVVIRDSSIAQKKNIQSIPDMLVEILSPSTTHKDRKLKRELYERFGVKEYLIVDPEGELIEAYRLEESGRYGKSEIYAKEDELELSIIPGCNISVSQIFNFR